MSRASKEEIAAENALYERLILALTESVTALSVEDLQKWGFRSGLFTNLDQQIDAVIESAKGREQIRSSSPLRPGVQDRKSATRSD
jgi:hypothetical protein